VGGKALVLTGGWRTTWAMRPLRLLALLFLLGTAMTAEAPPRLLDTAITAIDGKPYALSQHAGKVVLFVNVASKCGLTPQYAGLEALHQRYKDRGLVVIGVPANEFGAQEPGTNAEIQTFCSTKFNVTFPMMGKIVVKGAGIHPLYQQLVAGSGGGEIEWNFAKIIVGRDGKVAARLHPKVAPDSPELQQAVEKALGAP